MNQNHLRKKVRQHNLYYPYLLPSLKSILCRSVVASLFGLAFTAGQFHLAFADDDPLGEILESKQVAKMKKGHHDSASNMGYPIKEWFKPGSNLEKIFTEHGSIRNLIEWLSIPRQLYSIGVPLLEPASTHIKAEVEVTDKKWHDKFKLTVLVGHPAYAAMLDGNLIPDFASRRLPDLNPESSQSVVIEGLPANMYMLKDENCTIVFELTQRTMLEIRSRDKCLSVSRLSAFASSLDLIRLEQRLQS